MMRVTKNKNKNKISKKEYGKRKQKIKDPGSDKLNEQIVKCRGKAHLDMPPKKKKNWRSPSKKKKKEKSGGREKKNNFSG